MVDRVVSGGQTGVDRAALDAALESGLACGGWCPQGRRAEDGPIPVGYPLQETPSSEYAQRTEWNVRDSDATLILTRSAPTGGTALTADLARRLRKPLLIIDFDQNTAPRDVREWIRRESVSVLNVAGPRESTAPGIYRQARAFLTELLREAQEP